MAGDTILGWIRSNGIGLLILGLLSAGSYIINDMHKQAIIKIDALAVTAAVMQNEMKAQDARVKALEFKGEYTDKSATEFKSAVTESLKEIKRQLEKINDKIGGGSVSGGIR